MNPCSDQTGHSKHPKLSRINTVHCVVTMWIPTRLLFLLHLRLPQLLRRPMDPRPSSNCRSRHSEACCLASSRVDEERTRQARGHAPSSLFVLALSPRVAFLPWCSLNLDALFVFHITHFKHNSSLLLTMTTPTPASARLPSTQTQTNNTTHTCACSDAAREIKRKL